VVGFRFCKVAFSSYFELDSARFHDRYLPPPLGSRSRTQAPRRETVRPAGPHGRPRRDGGPEKHCGGGDGEPPPKSLRRWRLASVFRDLPLFGGEGKGLLLEKKAGLARPETGPSPASVSPFFVFRKCQSSPPNGRWLNNNPPPDRPNKTVRRPGPQAGGGCASALPSSPAPAPAVPDPKKYPQQATLHVKKVESPRVSRGRILAQKARGITASAHALASVGAPENPAEPCRHQPAGESAPRLAPTCARPPLFGRKRQRREARPPRKANKNAPTRDPFPNDPANQVSPGKK